MGMYNLVPKKKVKAIKQQEKVSIYLSFSHLFLPFSPLGSCCCMFPGVYPVASKYHASNMLFVMLNKYQYLHMSFLSSSEGGARTRCAAEQSCS